MKRLALLFFLTFTGCIGTDLVEDEIVTLNINIENETLVNNAAAAITGDQYTFAVTAINDRGSTYRPNVSWNSSNTNVATIDESGSLQAVAPGITFITATATALQSNQIMISVVENSTDVALIEISGGKSTIDIEERIALNGRALNAKGEEVSDINIDWQSENETIASVSSSGEVSGISAGSTNILATAENITAMYPITVGQVSERRGQFNGLSGYNTSGSVILKPGPDGGLALELGDDFRSSNGPGLYLYLSNSNNTISGGIEVGKLRSNRGTDTYSVPQGITLEQFDHVILYCKPFGVPFGTAELNSDL